MTDDAKTEYKRRQRAMQPPSGRYAPKRTTAAEPAWMARAACRGKPTDWWFALPKTWEYDEAERICAHCPVKLDCTEDAARHREWGRWGAYVMLGARTHSPGTHVRRFEPGSPAAICDGCGLGFDTASGLVSHQSRKRCGRAWPELEPVSVAEVAAFERAIDGLASQVASTIGGEF